MKPLTNFLMYVEEELDPSVWNRVLDRAGRLGSKLTLAAVVKPARSQVLCASGSLDLDLVERLLVEDRKRQLDDIVKSVTDAPVDVATRVFVGDPTEAIIQAVQNEGYDLVLKTPSPAHGLRQQLFGSIDMRLMRACPCSVCIVHPRPIGASGRAVAAVDCDRGDETKASLNQAILDGMGFAFFKDSLMKELHIVHAWSLYGETLLASGRGKMPPDRFQAALKREEAERKEWLDGLVARYRDTLDAETAASFNPKLSLLHGNPNVVIPQLVKELSADILGMGTASRRGIRGMLLGNTAEAILTRVSCSVVTHKPEGFEAPV